MESRGVAGRPKDPKGAQGGSPKEGPKEDPKRIPKGPRGAGDPAHLLILVPGERLGRQHEPILLGAALHDADVVDGQPAPADHLRPRGRYGAVMGPPQPPAPHRTHSPTASSSSWISAPGGGVVDPNPSRKKRWIPRAAWAGGQGPPEAPRPHEASPTAPHRAASQQNPTPTAAPQQPTAACCACSP